MTTVKSIPMCRHHSRSSLQLPSSQSETRSSLRTNFPFSMLPTQRRAIPIPLLSPRTWLPQLLSIGFFYMARSIRFICGVTCIRIASYWARKMATYVLCSHIKRWLCRQYLPIISALSRWIPEECWPVSLAKIQDSGSGRNPGCKTEMESSWERSWSLTSAFT